MLLLALLSPSALHAHARFLRSEPAAGSTVSVPPGTVRLVFSEAPEIAFSSIRLVTPGGDTLAIGNLRHDSLGTHALTGDIPLALEDGPYRIVWRTAARDGHVLKGTVEFRVASVRDTAMEQRAADPAISDEDDAATMAVRGALTAIWARWLSFVSIFLLIGVVTFRFAVLRRMSPSSGNLFNEIASTNAATLGIAASAGLLLAAALRLGRESADMPDVSLRTMMLGSLWGWSVLIEMIAPIVAALAFRMAQRSAKGHPGNAWLIALAAAASLAIAPSLGSHASAGRSAWLAVPVDAVHVAVGSMWLGTLAVIVIVGMSATLKTPDDVRPGERVAAMINIFSPLALTCGGAVVATGVGSSVLRLPAIEALWTTPYGVALLLKLVFVGLLFGAGAWNWKRMKPRLTGDDAGPLRSSASLELLMAAVVLGITAILVALELP